MHTILSSPLHALHRMPSLHTCILPLPKQAPTTPAAPAATTGAKFRYPFARRKRLAWGGALAFAVYILATIGYVIIRSMFTLPLTYVYGC